MTRGTKLLWKARNLAVGCAVILSTLGVSAKHAHAVEPMMSCSVTGVYWRHSVILKSLVQGGSKASEHSFLVSQFRYWNPRFAQEGFFIADGSMTMSEWNSKQATLSYRRAEDFASRLAKIGIPRDHIKIMVDAYPWQYNDVTLGTATYCWRLRCPCPNDNDWREAVHWPPRLEEDASPSVP